MNKENIKFEILVEGIFFDKAPFLEIYIDDVIQFSDYIDGLKKIHFFNELQFGVEHTLKLKRSNYDLSQTLIKPDGEKIDQVLEIKKIKIDDIDCDWLCNDNSYAVFDYPSHVIRNARNREIILPEKTFGSKILTFNGTWIFNFTSPFYEYIMKRMGGGVF